MAAVASKSPLVSNLDSFYNTSTDEVLSSRAITSSSLARNQQEPGEASGSRSYENGMPHSLAPSSEQGQEAALTLDEDFPEPICGGCKKMIDEESADAGVIHFATQLWHVDCFRCAKCQNLVTTDCDDILLLSDGNPICGQCSYSCQICGLPIMEEAIMTGDESYHAACFTCRSCHSPIAELVFAKTSQGIYCMKCHNQRVARSRRHADKKKGASSKSSKRAEGGKSNQHSLGTLGTTSKGGEQSPTPSASVEGSPMVGYEGEGSFGAKMGENSASSMSLSPYATQGLASSTGSPSKRPLNPPLPAPMRDVRDKEGSTLHRGTAGAEVEHSPSKARSLSRSDQLPSLPFQATSPGGRSTRSEREPSLSRESSTVGDKQPPPAGPPSAVGTGKEAKQPLQSEDASHRLQPLPAPPQIIRPLSGSDGEGEGEGEGEEDAAGVTVQYKRASRLSVNKGLNLQEAPRLSKMFSFYDPDIVSLMDSIGRFESSDELSLDMPSSKGNLAPKTPLVDREAKSTLNPVEETDKAHEERQRSPERLKTSESGLSLHQISSKMRESVKQARNGHVSMDTHFVESVLEDLETTRERMKTLQRKYDRIRRASQQAAQGFSSAREEYEQEVQARYDAEAEMLSLKRQLHLQASKLTEMTTEKKAQESLQRRSQQVKKSLQGMERDLTKLTVERDLTVAEVAELVALQDGRNLPLSGNEESIKLGLTKRLESVKDRYRQELLDLQTEREALLIKVEELRQSRDVFAEESATVNNRNEELSATLTHLTRRVEHAEASASVDSQSRGQIQSPNSASQGRSNAQGTTGFGFGFGKQHRQTSAPHSASASSTTTAVDPLGGPSEGIENVALQRYAPVPVTKVDAVPKKFKWKKTPKLTAESAKTAGQQLAAGFQGVMGPSPPVPPKATGPQTSLYNHPQSGGGPPQHGTAQSHQSAPSESLSSSNGHNNGSSNGEMVVKEHLFQPFSVLRPMRCFACQKNMWGQSEMKCSLCHQVCHVRCLQSLPTSCNQPFTRSDEATPEYTGPSMFGRNLIEQVQSERPERRTPLVVEKCIQAVEKLGMDYEGIYRKSGGTSQLKIITQLFENRQPFNLEDSDRFNDISAITSVLKNYFRELPEPLLTFDLHEKFIDCVETKTDPAKKEADMRELVRTLPKEHFDTLKVLVLHLHRVQGKAEENRMNSRNLGVVFGPTLMRSGDPAKEFAHMGGKAMTIEFMIDNPYIFD